MGKPKKLMRLAVGVSSAVVHIATAITPQLGGADRTTNFLAESSVIDSGGASWLGIELYVCRMSTFYPSHCMLQETWNSRMPRDVNALQPQFELSVHHFCPEMELSLKVYDHSCSWACLQQSSNRQQDLCPHSGQLALYRRSHYGIPSNVNPLPDELAMFGHTPPKALLAQNRNRARIISARRCAVTCRYVPIIDAAHVCVF